MFYLIEWIVLIVLTLVASFGAFFWALENGQFQDQERAAFLPLRDLPPEEDAKRRPIKYLAELYVLSFGSIMVLGAILLAVAFAIWPS